MKSFIATRGIVLLFNYRKLTYGHQRGPSGPFDLK